MPYTAQFFAEKLNVPVEYFNPFRNVQIDPSVNLEELSRVAHGLGEVVGLGLRNLATCPVEMNLMPDSTLRWQSFNQKKPYLVATVFSLVLVAFAVGYLLQKLTVNKEAMNQELTPKVLELTVKSENFKKAYARLQKTQKETEQITTWLQQRYYWGDFMAEMRRAMIRSEGDIKKKFAAQNPTVEAGIWIEQMAPASSLGAASAATGDQNGQPSVPAGQGANNADANFITLVCRAVNLTSLDPSANSAIAYAVENEIKASPMVDPKTTQLVGQITTDELNGTFTFTVNVTPLKPVNF